MRLTVLGFAISIIFVGFMISLMLSSPTATLSISEISTNTIWIESNETESFVGWQDSARANTPDEWPDGGGGGGLVFEGDSEMGMGMAPPDDDDESSGDSYHISLLRPFIETEPDKVRPGQAFLLRARYKSMPIELNLETRLASAKATIELGGANIDSNQEQVLGTDGTAVWALSIDKPETHYGLIKLHSDEFREGEITNDLIIDVEDIPQETNWLVLVGTVLGLLVAIANLIKFYWEWRKRRSEIPAT